VKFDAGDDWGESFVPDNELWGLRSQQAAYTNKDCAEQDRLPQLIPPHVFKARCVFVSRVLVSTKWFDFTLATA
jgi:hypothetical protein